MKDVAELNQKFESQKGRADEKVRQDFERILSLTNNIKGRASSQVKKLQNQKVTKILKKQLTLLEKLAEGKSVEQSGQKRLLSLLYKQIHSHQSTIHKLLVPQ